MKGFCWELHFHPINVNEGLTWLHTRTFFVRCRLLAVAGYALKQWEPKCTVFTSQPTSTNNTVVAPPQYCPTFACSAQQCTDGYVQAAVSKPGVHARQLLLHSLPEGVHNACWGTGQGEKQAQGELWQLRHTVTSLHLDSKSVSPPLCHAAVYWQFRPLLSQTALLTSQCCNALVHKGMCTMCVAQPGGFPGPMTQRQPHCTHSLVLHCTMCASTSCCVLLKPDLPPCEVSFSMLLSYAYPSPGSAVPHCEWPLADPLPAATSKHVRSCTSVTPNALPAQVVGVQGSLSTGRAGKSGCHKLEHAWV